MRFFKEYLKIRFLSRVFSQDLFITLSLLPNRISTINCIGKQSTVISAFIPLAGLFKRVRMKTRPLSNKRENAPLSFLQKRLLFLPLLISPLSYNAMKFISREICKTDEKRNEFSREVLCNMTVGTSSPEGFKSPFNRLASLCL